MVNRVEKTAKLVNEYRQPIHRTISTKGVEATRFPAMPMDTKTADRVANQRGENQVVISFREPMKLHAMPIPNSSLPVAAVETDSDHANPSAPNTPTTERTVMVALAPTRSRNIPMGIWVRAKE